MNFVGPPHYAFGRRYGTATARAETALAPLVVLIQSASIMLLLILPQSPYREQLACLSSPAYLEVFMQQWHRSDEILSSLQRELYSPSSPALVLHLCRSSLPLLQLHLQKE